MLEKLPGGKYRRRVDIIPEYRCQEIVGTIVPVRDSSIQVGIGILYKILDNIHLHICIIYFCHFDLIINFAFTSARSLIIPHFALDQLPGERRGKL